MYLFLTMKNIIECIPGAATPMNTLGMGTVEPCVTDPMPTISFKRKKRRKKRMKHLKDIIIEKLKINPNKQNNDILETVWDVSDFKSFYMFFKYMIHFLYQHFSFFYPEAGTEASIFFHLKMNHCVIIGTCFFL